MYFPNSSSQYTSSLQFCSNIPDETLATRRGVMSPNSPGMFLQFDQNSPSLCPHMVHFLLNSFPLTRRLSHTDLGLSSLATNLSSLTVFLLRYCRVPSIILSNASGSTCGKAGSIGLHEFELIKYRFAWLSKVQCSKPIFSTIFRRDSISGAITPPFPR